MATARRDTLLELQAKAQKKWADEKTFEVTAPRDGTCDLGAPIFPLGRAPEAERDRERFRVASVRDVLREDDPSMNVRSGAFGNPLTGRRGTHRATV